MGLRQNLRKFQQKKFYKIWNWMKRRKCSKSNNNRIKELMALKIPKNLPGKLDRL
jgi:hypothetical protein